MSVKRKDTFIQEYLYIEEMPPSSTQEKFKKNQTDQTDRGVFVIDLFNDDEEEKY